MLEFQCSSWSDLQEDLNRIDPDRRGDHIAEKLEESLATSIMAKGLA